VLAAESKVTAAGRDGAYVGNRAFFASAPGGSDVVVWSKNPNSLKQRVFAPVLFAINAPGFEIRD
jgi:hypothetical protein